MISSTSTDLKLELWAALPSAALIRVSVVRWHADLFLCMYIYSFVTTTCQVIRYLPTDRLLFLLRIHTQVNPTPLPTWAGTKLEVLRPTELDGRQWVPQWYQQHILLYCLSKAVWSSDYSPQNFFECLDTERRKKSGKIGFQPTRSRAIDTAAMPSIVIDRDFFWFAEVTTFSYCLCSGGNVGCDEDDV